MASLANKDSYLQTLAKKICAQEVNESRKRKFGTGPGGDSTQPKKKRKKAKKKEGKTGSGKPAVSDVSKASSTKKPVLSSTRKFGAGSKAAQSSSGSATPSAKENGSQNSVADGKAAPSSFSAMDVLRQRLHEKMREISGQGSSKELSPAVLEKRQRRKYEKERKKRRRKELRLKEKMEKKEAAEAAAAATASESPVPKDDSKAEMVFNKVETPQEELSKAEKRKEKRNTVKGNITPLTGKNYKQLLTRLESRKSKLEELRDKDEKKAKELEAKMQWTNVLYKAEGVKIRDDEERLKAALRRKEKRKAQRKRQWEKRTEQVVEKMQQRQDKRRKNLRKKKLAKEERKKTKARKKGRILPEDLAKASLK
ncbi:surfeit locus protein 6 [Tiliqua scincoides]|uniref:surfeit locus protein 6 n=1 Tax=Tiliqua scincoides TaxID=71010 RepID=UPI00346331F7